MDAAAIPALMDIFYLGPTPYFAHLLSAPAVRLEQWAPYLKGTYANKCVIAASGGTMVLSVPLLSGKHLQPLNEVRIAYHEPWQKRHWRSIRDAYRKAPFFEHYAERIEPHYRQQTEFLAEWNLGLLHTLLDCMRLSPDISLTEHYDPAPENCADLRRAFAYKARLKRPHPEYAPLPYVQVFQDRHGFIPNLSTLDLLFCTGPEAQAILRRSITKMQNNPT